MYLYLFGAVFAVFSFLRVNAQIVSNGQCDETPQPMANFNLEAYLGLWYEIAKTPIPFQNGDCATARYTFNEETGSVDVYNTEILENFYSSINGTATLAGDDGRGALIVDFPSTGPAPTESNYWVLDSDYASYSLVYTCSNINSEERSIFVWKLGRTTSFGDNMNVYLNVLINNIDGVSAGDLVDTDHSEGSCFVLSELETGEAVVFDGQCDLNIPVVENFDTQRFMGLWHDVASYPAEFQNGTCRNSFYSLTEDGFDIAYTQVTDRLLESVAGTAVVSGTDGRAILLGTFPDGQGGTVQSEYRIVGTDYENHALVYSCIDLNEQQMRVFSWKLSRSKQLSASSDAAINSIISTIIVLNNRYYETTNQSDDGCFYLPEPVAGQQVIFPGQCDETILAMANFDAERYMGLWHDIESYPSQYQDGTCNNALYALTAEGAVDVVNTQVVNERLASVSGVARVVSDDGSAKLVVNFTIPDTVDVTTETDYWVLDTDYENYALVYSCLNINTESRQVTSWKLSRTKQLNAIGNNAINAAIEVIDVLDQQYYEAKDQSDDSCFYFPDARPGEHVVFPGQCDVNVAVVTDFDVERYLGLWHDISSYPSTFQDGSCNNALYTLGSNDIVEVYNTQVLDGFLDIINGTATLNSTDGSAKLVVTFPISGTSETVEIPYWVLATDYDTWALVYACLNLNVEQRGVWSWKLSRSKVLPDGANALMDTAIAAVQVLEAEYYHDKDQSDEGCFYLPELSPGEPVIIVGQCDLTINVVQNFDANRFSGLWHEIEAYASDNQNGTCNNALYTVNEQGTVDVYNTQVIEQLLDSISGNAVPATGDGSGKLLVTLQVGENQFVTSEIWILDTDYETYSLLYSCVNIDTQNRRVWSWKLSRSRNLLSQSGATAIDAIIGTIPVLNQQYFLSTDQSDESCFYYPEPNGQTVTFRGQCDESIPAVSNFDPERYSGLWHNIESYPTPFQADGTCANALYTLNEDGTVAVYNTHVISELLDSVNGSARLSSDDGSGKLVVTFPIAGTDQTIDSNYWVVATDYDNYALVYSCTNTGEDERTVFSWKLSRSKQLTAASNTAITAAVGTIEVLDAQYYESVDQSDEGCFYYPEPVRDQPVVFPGQCDESIAVVQDFNPDRYAGLWHEISSYPSVFQSGSCNNALYTLTSEGIVEVYNTQVLDERLDVINGSATLASTDGSAKLTVSFPIPGTTETTETPYWVLATDYDTYSLVYTCVNINSEERAVHSWELSRTKELSAAAQVTIDAVKASVQVLDEQYYQQRDQSDDACFYLPYLEPGEPVVFVGQCDQTIPAHPNFDASRFSGLWHEIEAYSSDNQNATCNNAQYTVNEQGTVDVYNTQVIDQLLDSISGNAVPATGDGSGKLLVTLQVGDNQFVTSEIWILDTDYETYSLLYSCDNIDTQNRRVWSWKLSRSRNLLSQSGATAIDAIIDNIPVLNQEYFLSTDQSDESCFYYPEPNGQTVTFRGQCDESIPAVFNFDLERYSGLWYDIESYPRPFRANGTCANGLYTLNEDGTVAVYNTHVISELLDSVNGSARLSSDDGSGKLLVTLPFAGTDQTIESNYWVVATDYDNYALVYSCTNTGEDERTVFSWKLSRSKQLTAASNTAITAAVGTIEVLDAQYYESVDQSDEGCFYYPEPVRDQPVVFPGQCDESIAVVQDFNPERYAGLWHEISSYPSVFQSGSCNNALYTLTSEGIVEVYNTQVLDERLDFINGSATLASTDGSAKLTVSFPIPGTTETTETPYWVLATDYDTYSLVYTCVNINSEERAVHSWELSRTKELSAAAQVTIDAVKASVQVLDEQYYQQRDQSDDACFYLPYLEPGEPVVFVGQCDQTIPAHPNFDASRFSGLWHEIEAYSSDNQNATCNNAQYTVNEQGTVDVYNTQVIDQLLDSISGNAVPATGDGSGKLLFTLQVGDNQFVTSEIWILDTDYETYSLLYSCDNIDTQNRRVWSWKLSRSRNLLSQSGATAIDAIIDNIPVLNQEYFLSTDQSDESCFYYPEPNGQTVTFRGQCDESIPAVFNFDLERYSGLWYDIESYPRPFQANGTCANGLYTLNEDGTVAVYNTHVISELLDSANGSARLSSDDGSGKLLVTLPFAGTDQTIESNYWVVATDYDNYALVYSCTNTGEDERTVFSWKLSRSKQLTAASNTAITAAVGTIEVLDAQYYESVDQSDEGCFYYPEPVRDQPVVFPGQCDESIAVVQDFNPERYAGLWHEISSYPSVFQSGSCNNALYTLTSEGIVEVYNTQVLDERLDFINGSATLASTDGSAKLTVSFPIPGTTETTETPYWVLATDYDTYSLVYSCVNINTEERAVHSWELSRTKELSAAAQVTIDAVKAAVQVLDEQYYQHRDQSDDACFYLPYLEPGEPVVFVGQCDQYIPAHPNIDAVRYAGLWHEIEGYPSAFQYGTCNNALYTLTPDGTLDVFNTQVVDERLDTISGVARAAADDGSGKFVVIFPIAGTDQTTTADYWVLGTDYDSFSLVYSCINLDPEHRQVWTWKLSRSKQLTDEARDDIARIVDTVPVLNEEYYSTRDQRDESCFYFPVHVVGQPVVFPGECDETVEVVQNFDVERYSGFWYDVESYPQQFQAGAACANALYTLNDAGTVDVHNTQVLNQQLDTVDGVARLVDDSGSAKLIVTFPITGTDLTIDSDYWVLSTDYENYALVYSCTNIGDRRSVSSWKLSRQSTLSTASAAAINTAIDAVQVLTEEYFEETGQTEADCFYYPDNNGGPVILDGQCEADEDIPVVNNFNVAQYEGLWHESARFPTEFQTGQCARAQYTINAQTGAVDVVNTIVYDELQGTINGEAAVAGDDGRGILTVTFPSNQTETPSVTNYYILDTDYQNFALVYSCRNVDLERKQVYSWKLSRDRQGLSSTSNERIEAIVSERVDLFEGYYEETDQGDAACFHYPEFAELNSAIILPGPCNQTIQGMANFEAGRYTGRWFEVARYPQEFEVGECARAEYTLTPTGVVDVVNSNVVSETLETVVGTAVASSDGSGLFTVTLPVSGTDGTREAYYYVLETDYDSFALVYTCRDLDSGDRQVSSWKLSRARTLTTESETLIDPMVERTQGLLESYYLYTDQSDEACFYIPELDESLPIAFPGQCEDIAAMDSFDMQEYLGWWHEIEHFPSGFETGTCLSSQYRAVDGIYSNTNTSVSGLEAKVISNNLIYSTEQPGRLRKTLDNGEEVDILVLATDYETYSLLLSCQNIGTEYRHVWSAKHSKARQLTEAAQSAMAPYIDSLDILREEFYLPVDQSDNACFHYPALAAGEQVVLPGQCDDSIPVVNNFDVASYTGLWFQVERYPQVSEFGSCPTSRYTLDSQTGLVTVVNSQVVDGESVDIEGSAVLSSPDGGGRLTVTFPVEDTEGTTSMELYILGTDYTSYALVYTCTNVNQFQRSVGSWKLSRTRDMTAPGTAAINSIISARPELHQPYFIESGQSEECPEPSSGALLRGTLLLVTLLTSLLHLLS